MHYDLIIIGMGLSGLMAAKTALDLKKSVLIIGKGMGGLTLFSNTIDVLGRIPETLNVKNGWFDWIKDHPEHPYSKIGVEGIEEALSSFVSLFPPPYTFHSLNQRNTLLPTAAGTLRPTYLFPSTLSGGASLKEGHTLIVGFNGFKDFYPGYMARAFKCRHLILSIHEEKPPEVTATFLSRLMEKEGFRERIGSQIKDHLKGESLVGLPALLGLRNPMSAKEHLEAITGVEIFEIPTLPPSTLGIRIFNRFKAHLMERGAHFLLGHKISRVQIKGSVCEGIEVFHPPISRFYTAHHFILATGRFIGGGLEATRKRVFEPLFNLPVLGTESPEGWFRKSFFDDHPIHGFGISVDSSFRPLDFERKPVLENVRVVGTILSGHHALYEGSREGIEISTGYWAVKRLFK